MQHGKLVVDDLVKIADAQVPYLLNDYVPTSSIGILVGEWGLGKSPFALQLQLSMATNIAFMGRWKPSKDKIRCLYIDMENGPRALLKVISTLRTHIGAKDFGNFEFYSPNFTPHEVGLENVPEYHYILHLIKKDPVDFVIIDPLRLFQPQAEAKNSEAATMIKKIRDLISEAGSTVMFIHHPRKISGDPSVERYHLDTNPTEWMSNACGAASLIQNADFRIGLEDSEDGLIVCRRFIRNLGWQPVEYIDRAYDDPDSTEPTGYVLKTGIEQLKPQEKDWLMRIGKTFNTNDFFYINGKSKRRTQEILKRWESLGIISGGKRGEWVQL